MDILGSRLMLPQILLPTRITENSKTLIDDIISTPTGDDCTSGNILHSISDHLPQFLLFTSCPTQSDGGNISKTLPLWSQFNQENFLRDFRNLNWQEILTLEDENVNTSFESFNFKVTELVDRHLPTRQFTLK